MPLDDLDVRLSGASDFLYREYFRKWGKLEPLVLQKKKSTNPTEPPKVPRTLRRR